MSMELQTLTNTIRNMINSDVRVYAQTVQKGNRTLTGISIGKGNTLPTVYMENYENLFQEKGYIGVASEMIKVCKEVSESRSFDIGNITSWDYAKEHLQLCIASARTNNGFATIPYLDLELYFRVKVSEDGTYKVKNEMLDSWGVAKETILQIAFNSSEYIATSMRDTMVSLLMEQGVSDELIEQMLGDTQDADQTVLSNSTKSFGASVIYKTELLKEIADKYESDLYIIPSSIHELIALPKEDISVKEMNDMIKEVNANEVSPEEVLSDHVYIFLRDSEEVIW